MLHILLLLPFSSDSSNRKRRKRKARRNEFRHFGLKEKKRLTELFSTKTTESDEIWTTTSTAEERERIRNFWLQLGEEERRSLVKIEKEAVLRKMKEQQRHSCNCSVCGKKR